MLENVYLYELAILNYCILRNDCFSDQMHIEILSLTVLFPRSSTLHDNSIDFPFIAVIVLRITVVSNVGPCTFFSLSFSDIE